MTSPSHASSRLTGAAVLVVEDHEVLGSSLAAVLTAVGACAETAVDLGFAAFGREIDSLVEAHGQLIVLLDLDLGPALTGEQLLPELLRPGVKVLVLSGCEEPVRLSHLLKSGVSAVLSKTEPLERILEAVEALFVGTPAMSAASATKLHLEAQASEVERARREQPFRTLTHREGDVLLGLMRGRTVAELAEESVLSVETVRSQVKAILAKLGVRTQLAAVARARNAGWSG